MRVLYLNALFVVGAASCASQQPCDGVVSAGEECDDGNQNPDDGCDCHAHPPWLAPLEDRRDNGFVVIEDDGAFCWFQDERAIFTGNRLAVSSVSHAGDIQVSSYDLASGEREHGMLHRSLERDDHDAASLLPLPDGRIAAFYTRHDGFDQMRWRVSDSPSLATWGPERSFAIDNNVTYSNPFLLAEGSATPRMYVFFRGLQYNPTVATSDDLGETWREPLQLIDSHTDGTIERVDQRPYVKYASNGSDTVHLFYTEGHPSEFGATSLYHLMYRNGELQRSDGAPVAPLLPEATTGPLLDPTVGTRIHDGVSEGATWPWDSAVDATGNPVVVYSVAAPDHTHSYRYARWDGASWRTALVARGGTSIYAAEAFYAGGITIDPDDPNVVYFSSNADPITGALTGHHFELFRGITVDNGASWKVTPVTIGSSVDNLRPIVPAHHPAGTAVVWMQGTYQTYIDVNTRIVALVGGVDAQIGVPPVDEPVTPAARFDLLHGESPASGFAAVHANGTTATASDGANDLTISNITADPDHPIAGSGCGWLTALTIDIHGLPTDSRALVRMHAVDTKSHYLSPILWYAGTGWWDDTELKLGGLAQLLAADRPANSVDGGESYVDVLLGWNDRRILGAGMCTGGDSTAFVDAIEVFPLSYPPAVAQFDVNRGGNHWSLPPSVPLELADGSYTASATDGAITVTVTTDQLDDRGPNDPYMNYFPGSESVLGHDSLAVDVTGLTIGKRYSIEVYSVDKDHFAYQSSRWRLDEPGREPRVVHGMEMNSAQETQYSFLFFHRASASSFRLRATDVLYNASTDPSVVLFGGMRIVELP